VPRIDFEYKGKAFSFLVNDHHIANEMMQRGSFYELHLLEKIRLYCKGGIFIDVGACFGNHAVYFVELCQPSYVIAFEPNPKTYSYIERNTEIYNFSTIGVIMLALSDEIGEATLTAPKTELYDLSIGGTSLEPIGNGFAGETFEVSKIPLDSFLNPNSTEPITCIKIDVEGHEMPVLRGAMETIKKWLPELFIEVWGESNLESIKAFLRPFGYELKQCYGVAPVYHFSIRQDIPVHYIKPAKVP
jgi:protein O-GlcNAc transferase